MKHNVLVLALIAVSLNSTAAITYDKPFVLKRSVLQDKIKGGWAGQTIGCTYGGPTEFKFKGGIINGQVPITWYDDYAWDTFKQDPGLYDDVYMDLTFVETLSKEGIDAPASSFARAFANADYKLWHANQAARYNILHGIQPPASGYWENNPHADDIDFEIESDFIGMICPGMPMTASVFCDTVGHIMNYGDGWYGGVYLGAVYTLAFMSNDIPAIIEEALNVIPPQSKYRQCIEDVIAYWKKDPSDWKKCWFEIEQKHGFDVGCPEGVFNGFDIDATINSAYVVIGLLYGNGDFFRTMDIATRCGQDSDCNPASAAGILGVIKGYDAIPSFWKKGLEKVTDIDFPYTSISLNKIYRLNEKLVESVVVRHGGKVEKDKIVINPQKPKQVRFEQSFTGLFPVERRVLKATFNDSIQLTFKGNSVVLMGEVQKVNRDESNYVALLDAYIDGKKVETFSMPYDYIKRKYDIFYRYNLHPDGEHKLVIHVLNPNENYLINAKEMVVYSSKPLPQINEKVNQ
ncbi:MAG: ADP-ribosylglycohydrolase family protein [Bacteroidota bacterium]|nr:ADP-ribosylglycohydrolase family protein [Bacteroidota bacterium]